MRIAVILPYFIPKIGGVENYTYNIYKILAKNNDITLICTNWGERVYKKEIIGNIDIYRIPYSFKVSSTPINFHWFDKISSIITEKNPDVINGHIPVPYIADIAARVAHDKNIPFVLTYHNDLTGYNSVIRALSNCYYRSLGNRTLKLSKKIIVTSEYYATSSPYLKTHFDKLEIVPPGVDINKYKLLGNIPKEKNSILFVGQLNRESQHKGLNYLLRAIKIVRNDIPEVKLTIVGKGNNIVFYKELSAFLEIEENVTFAGFISDEELPLYYNKSNVLVLPSYNRAEGFGIVLIEAQACQTPVIGTVVGGIPYVIKDGETGLLVPPRDPQKLAAAIIKMLTHENLRKEMGMRGRIRTEKDFTWEKSAGKTLQVLKNSK